MHVFFTIITAFVSNKVDLVAEQVSEDTYDAVLIGTWIGMILIAFFVAAALKTRDVNRVLDSLGVGSDRITRVKHAFETKRLGVETAEDTEILIDFVDGMRAEAVNAELAYVLDGARWAETKGRHAHPTPSNRQLSVKRMDAKSIRDLSILPSSAPLVSMHSVDSVASVGDVDTSIEDVEDVYYGKFDGGFVGSFADLRDFRGGLDKMIGPCRKDVMEAIRAEHCDVLDGFGASDQTFTSGSYQIETTPREEFKFVTEATGDDLQAGRDPEGREMGIRKRMDCAVLFDEAAARITAAFKSQGYERTVTKRMLRKLNLLFEEVVALRLYTGPM